MDVAKDLDTPFLTLHGTKDEGLPVGKVREYETALKSFNKTIETEYYEGGGHPVIAVGAPTNDYPFA